MPRARGAPGGKPSFAVEIHPDFQVLEDRLGDLIRETQSADAAGALAPVLVIAPTRRLLAHLQTTLAESTAAGRPGALLNVRFVHHDGLAHAVAAHAGVFLPRLAGDGVREAILGELFSRSGGALAEYVVSRPGSLAALLATMDDLREAGIEGGAAAPLGGLSETARGVLKMSAQYAEALRRFDRNGIGDRAAIIAAALPHAARFAGRFRLIVHYGAYELIGINFDLLAALATGGVPITVLAPGHPTAPAYVHAGRFWPSHAGSEPRLLDASPTHRRLLAERLPTLHDEEASVPPRLEGVTLVHAQGPAAELREVALRILDEHRGHGTALHRIAVVARSLEPYAPLLAPIFSEHGLPFQTTASRPLAREPLAQAALRLLRCLTEDMPARPLFDLLVSGQFLEAEPAGGRSEPPLPARVDAWERLAREWEIESGAALWIDRLPAWERGRAPYAPEDADDAARARAAEQRAERVGDAEALGRFVGRLVKDAGSLRKADSWSAWAAAVRALLKNRLRGYAAPGAVPPGTTATADAGAVRVLREIDDLETLDAAGVKFTGVAALAALSRAVASGTLPLGSMMADGTPAAGDQGGVRILDAMQARGLGFDLLFLIGLNADLFPRRPRIDPFLPDEDRRRLSASLKRRLPFASETADEEHLLLAHLLGAARCRLVVSWQRADDKGKARAPSLLLREIARVALGEADLRTAEETALRLSAHPTEVRSDATRRLALLSPADATLLTALLHRSPAGLLDHPTRWSGALPPAARETFRTGLEFLAAIDRTSAKDLRFDALIGPLIPLPDRFSPSRLERLGACPQQYLFRDILKVDEWEEPGEIDSLDSRDTGLMAHSALQHVYQTLQQEGLLRSATLDAAQARAATLLPEAWETGARTGAFRLRARYPRLWDILRDQWIEALAAFVRADLPRLVARPGPRLDLEAPMAVDLDLAPGETLRLAGRPDRVLREESGDLVVSDYKSSGSLDDHIKLADAFKGNRLQMALYTLLAQQSAGGTAAPNVQAEVLGVGPRFDPLGPEPIRLAFNVKTLNQHRAGFLETLRVLVALARSGSYPLNEMSRLCNHCRYTRACRKDHPPTLDRLAASPGVGDFLLTRGKSSRRPTLAEVRAPGAEEDE